MKVIHIDKINTSKVDSFLLLQKTNNVFQSLLIGKVFKSVKNYEPFFLFVENEKGKIIGLLLSIIQKEHAGILGFFSSRSIIIGGPIILNNNPRVLDMLLEKYNEKIKHRVIYSQFRNLREISSNEKDIFIKHGYNYEPHLDIIHNLSKPIEEQWMALHKGRRKNIRRAERMGVVFREVHDDHEFEKAFELVKGTYKRVKLPMPDKTLFLESFKELTANDIFKVFVAMHNDEIIATRMVLCYNKLVYDWYAGASALHMDKYLNDFLPWKVMEWGSNNGYEYFDFGGAGKPNVAYGVRDHKLKFGGELVNFGRFQKTHFPLLYKMIEFGFKLYRKHIG